MDTTSGKFPSCQSKAAFQPLPRFEACITDSHVVHIVTSTYASVSVDQPESGVTKGVLISFARNVVLICYSLISTTYVTLGESWMSVQWHWPWNVVMKHTGQRKVIRVRASEEWDKGLYHLKMKSSYPPSSRFIWNVVYSVLVELPVLSHEDHGSCVHCSLHLACCLVQFETIERLTSGLWRCCIIFDSEKMVWKCVWGRKSSKVIQNYEKNSFVLVHSNNFWH
jgi:hypothetical protein